MAITLTTLGSRRHVWGATVTLNGQPFTVVDRLPTRSWGLTHQRSVCSVVVQEYPDVPAGSPAVVTITLNGQSETFFTGRVDARPIADYPRTYEVSLVDAQSRLDAALSSDVVWSSRSVPDAVRDLLLGAGLTNAEIASIYNPGSVYTLGSVEPITIPAGTVVSQVLRELLDYAGLALLSLPDGRIQVADAPGWPDSAATLTYAYDPVGDDLIFTNARRTLSGFEGRVARFTAKGPRLPDGTIPDATFTLSGVTGETVEQQYRWVQSEDAAKAIAEREIVRRNRSATEVQVSAPLHPTLRPGFSVQFRHPILGWPANTPALVISTSSDDSGGMTMLLSVGPQPAEGELTIIPPPSPSFSMRYEVQPVELEGVLQTNVVVEAIDTSSDPSGFEMTSRQWTAACSGDTLPSPTSATAERPIFVFPTLEGATLTLAVESSSGEGASITLPVAPPPGTQFTRTLSIASGSDGWRVLDGPAGWRSFTAAGSCTAVPQINDQGPLIAGFQSGDLYLSTDWLRTLPELLYTFPGAVACIWVNEGNPQQIILGAGTGLYRSSDGGYGWTLVFSFGATVRHAESSPANPNEMRVCAGQHYWISFDGSTFEPFLEGATGTTCRAVASAPWGHLVVWDAATLVDSYQFEEDGYAIDWSGVPPEEQPSSLTAATPMQYREGFMVAAPPAARLVRDGLYGELSYLAATGSGVRLYALEPTAPGQFAARTITTTTRGGAMKVVNLGGAYGIDTPTSALAIGYGTAVNPELPPQLLLLPYGQSGPADRLWLYDPELQTWIGREMPLPSAPWSGCALSPSQPGTWLIWAGWHAYITENAGQTWVQIYLPDAGAWASSGGIRDAIFTGPRAWLITALYFDAFGTSRAGQAYYVRGSGSTPTNAWSNGSSIVTPAPSGVFCLLTNLARGANGEVFGYASQGIQPYPAFDILTPDVTAIITGTSITLGQETPYRLMAAGPDTRTAYGTWSSNLARTTDYRSVAPTPLLAAGGSVAVCELGVVVGDRNGIGLLTGEDGPTPAVQVVAGGDALVGPICVGSLGRGAGAVTVAPVAGTQRRIYAYNGAQWASVLTPEGVSAVCLRVGVIER